jgi:hypothetical protein
MPTRKSLQKRRKTIAKAVNRPMRDKNVNPLAKVETSSLKENEQVDAFASKKNIRLLFDNKNVNISDLREILAINEYTIPNVDYTNCPLYLCAKNSNKEAVELIVETCGNTTCAYNLLLGSMHSGANFEEYLRRFVDKLNNDALLNLITESMRINQEKMKTIFDYLTIRKRADLGFAVKDSILNQIQKMIDDTKSWYQKWFSVVGPYENCIIACQTNDLNALVKYEALNSSPNSGSPITQHDNLLMKIAICHENIAMMKFLSECGCDMESLDFAIEMGALRSVKWLVSNSVNMKSDAKYKFSLNHSKHIELAKNTNSDLYAALKI